MKIPTRTKILGAPLAAFGLFVVGCYVYAYPVQTLAVVATLVLGLWVARKSPTFTAWALQTIASGMAAFVVLLALSGTLGAIIASVRFADSPKFRYSVEYGAPDANVIVQDKPENCDYDWSPIGKKGCHYEKSVAVFQDDNKQNHVIVSWDKQDDQ